jgi:zinc transport system substrate-binding protein
MKKITILILIINTFLFAKINTIVSILPQKTFLQAIGGNKVDITIMVKPGNSPHTYEPKPSQMKAIAKADIYFSIGVEFERVWLDRFKNQNSKMKIINISKGIDKITIKKHSHKIEDHGERKDPHIWTNPANVKILAKNIYDALISIDKINKNYYKDNLNKFLLHIENTDKKIKTILNQKHFNFMVFHPSWGYFAKEYNLTQIPIEIAGKNPKPKELKHLIEEAKKDKVTVIFTSPEFSDAIAKQMANELKIPVKKVSPLNLNWSQNLIDFAKDIAN